MATKSLPTRLPPRTRIVYGADGKSYLTGKSRRRYKTPKSVRNKIAASARRIKLPILTLGALYGGLHLPIKRLIDGDRQGASDALIWAYTGWNASTQKFEMRGLARGVIPLLAVLIINKSGVLRPVNQQLGRHRIPLRLS